MPKRTTPEKAEPASAETIVFSFRVSPSVKKEWQRWCLENDMTQSAALVRALRLLQEHGK